MSDELQQQTNPETLTPWQHRQLDLEIEILERVLTTLLSMAQEMRDSDHLSEEELNMELAYVQNYIDSYQVLNESFALLKQQLNEATSSDSTEESTTSEQ